MSTSSLFLILLVIGLAIYYVYSLELTKNTFMINSYLYITFTIVAALIFSSFDYNLENKNKWLVLGLLLLVSIFGICLIQSSNNFVSHIGLLLVILMIGVTLSPFQGTLMKPLLITVSLFIIISAITFILPDNVLNKLNSMYSYMVCGLCLLIIVSVVLIYFKPDLYAKNIKIISAITGILFIGFIVADTFNQSKSDLSKVNYPKSTINLFLDFINLLLVVRRFLN
jgi:FtsH-binding integral membrane protein